MPDEKVPVASPATTKAAPSKAGDAVSRLRAKKAATAAAVAAATPTAPAVNADGTVSADDLPKKVADVEALNTVKSDPSTAIKKRDAGGALASTPTSFFGAGGVLEGMLGEGEQAAIAESMMENVDANEIKIPRLSLQQPLSPLAVGREAKFRAGQVIDNVDNILLSSEVASPWLAGKVAPGSIATVDAVLFVPIYKLPSEFVCWKDRNTEGRGMHWKTLDRKDPRVRQGCWPPYGNWQAAADAERKAPPVTVNINFAGSVFDYETKDMLNELCIATFAKKSNAAGKDMVTKISRHMRRNIPIFGMSYWLWVYEEYDEKSNSTYYSLRCAQGPSIIDLFGERVSQVAARLLDTFKEFSNTETGRAAQEGFLNASSLDSDEFEEGLQEDAVNTVNADAIDVAAGGGGGGDDSEPTF